MLGKHFFEKVAFSLGAFDLKWKKMCNKPLELSEYWKRFSN